MRKMNHPARFYVAKDEDGTHVIRVRLTSQGYEVTDIIDEAMGLRHILAPGHLEEFLDGFAELREGDDAVEAAYKRQYKLIGPLKSLAIDHYDRV